MATTKTPKELIGISGRSPFGSYTPELNVVRGWQHRQENLNPTHLSGMVPLCS